MRIRTGHTKYCDHILTFLTRVASTSKQSVHNTPIHFKVGMKRQNAILSYIARRTQKLKDNYHSEGVVPPKLSKKYIYGKNYWFKHIHYQVKLCFLL